MKKSNECKYRGCSNRAAKDKACPSCWHAVHPDGTETYLGQRRELSPSYGVGDGGYDYQTYTERFTR